MFPANVLLAYLAAVLLVVLAPGPDNILAISRGLSQGRSAAVLSSIGAALGILCHTLAAALDHYAQAHGTDGRLAATFETVFLTAWSPHESQQQPLRPGSARARLADALGTTENPLERRPGKT